MTDTVLGDNVALQFDSAGQHKATWNATTRHIEIGGPVWITELIREGDVAAPLPPCGSGPNNWVLCSRVLYGANAGTTDSGQHCAMYAQMNRVGTEPGELWGMCIEARDSSGLPSSKTGVLQTLELDSFGNGPDDLTSQIGRTLLPLVIGQSNMSGAAYEVTAGITFNAVGTVSVKSPIAFGVPFTQAALDFRNSKPAPGAKLLWGHDDCPIALDTAGQATVRWNSTTRRFVLAYAGKDMLSLDAAGNMRIAGTLSTGTTV